MGYPTQEVADREEAKRDVFTTNTPRPGESPTARDRGAKALIAERGKTHGDYTVHAYITQTLKISMEQTQNWDRLNFTQRETLHMIAHKIGRILAGDPNFRDHWADIAGYAQLQADRSHEP